MSILFFDTLSRLIYYFRQKRRFATQSGKLRTSPRHSEKVASQHRDLQAGRKNKSSNTSKGSRRIPPNFRHLQRIPLIRRICLIHPPEPTSLVLILTIHLRPSGPIYLQVHGITLKRTRLTRHFLMGMAFLFGALT